MKHNKKNRLDLRYRISDFMDEVFLKLEKYTLIVWVLILIVTSANLVIILI